MKLSPLQVNDRTAPIPIIQGGMGIGISLSGLAGAVAKEGGIGVISAANPGYQEPDFAENPLEANLRALAFHIRRAKELSDGGIIGVNIMRAMRHYESYVRCSAEAGADIIFSGAGLPVELPTILGDAKTAYAPIVSSVKAARVLLERWGKRGLRLPSMIVIEGPKAGGHLGFAPDFLEEEGKTDFANYDTEVSAILVYVREFAKKHDTTIPVIFGGGVYTKEDIEHYIGLGCDGVQIGTRFIATEECDASPATKLAFLHAKEEDILLVQSPVGLPGRAIRTPFTTAERSPITRCHRCLEHCNPATTPYCITNALIQAAQGNIPEALLFCGTNAYRLDKITTVKELMRELTQ